MYLRKELRNEQQQQNQAYKALEWSPSESDLGIVAHEGT